MVLLIHLLADTGNNSNSINWSPNWTSLLQGGVLGVIVMLFVFGYIVSGKQHDAQVAQLADLASQRAAKIDELIQLMMTDVIPALTHSSEAVRETTDAVRNILDTAGALRVELEDLRIKRRSL